MAASTILIVAASGASAEDKPKSIWEQDTLTGDWGGARTALNDRGIDFTISYIGETLGIVTGSIERRTIFAGRLEFSVDSDLEKLIGWTGGKTHVTAYQIQNTKSGIDEYAGSIADPSSIDALHTTRLFTAWFEQSFGDVASLRIGQLAADDEFFTSNTAGGLINGTFGWASNLGANMLHGGPAYPFAAPGVRLKVDPAEGLSFLGAVFTGDPAGANCGKIDGDDIDPQTCNRHGFDAFALDGGSLWLGEVQYAVNQGKHAVGLPGVYKLGAWYETADFADQHFGLGAKGNVLTLADGSVTGPLNHGGDWGVYCVAIRWSGAARRAVSICSCAAAFRRPTAISLSYYIDGGAGIKGLLPRPP